MTTTINHIDDTRHHAGAMDDETPPVPEVPERIGVPIHYQTTEWRCRNYARARP